MAHARTFYDARTLPGELDDDEMRDCSIAYRLAATQTQRESEQIRIRFTSAKPLRGKRMLSP
jgi:hypothetical protein